MTNFKTPLDHAITYTVKAELFADNANKEKNWTEMQDAFFLLSRATDLILTEVQILKGEVGDLKSRLINHGR